MTDSSTSAAAAGRGDDTAGACVGVLSRLALPWEIQSWESRKKQAIGDIIAISINKLSWKLNWVVRSVQLT